MRNQTSFFVLVPFLGLLACGRAEESADGAGALRADPSTQVSTTDPGVTLLSGYNAFLDHATTTDCLKATGTSVAEIGDVTGTFYLRQVKTREDLARELDIDVGASVKAPQGALDATVKFVDSFKTSSTTVTFLVRSLRSYVASNRTSIELSPLALDLLNGANVPQFLQKCGGSYAKTVRYEAQVVAMLQFEAKTEESARTIETTFGGATPTAVKNVASATATLKAKAEQTASANNASLSISVSATGFLTNGGKVGGAEIADHSFEAIDDLNKALAASFELDIAADRKGYFANRSRNARASLVGQASYASLSNAPAVDFSRLSDILSGAEKFVNGVAPVYIRMERAHADEVSLFLSDTSNQYRYNLVRGPKTRTSDLVPIAQKWAVKLGNDGVSQGSSLVAPLRLAIETCTTAAANGNYQSCATSPELEKAKAMAEAGLADYASNGRIVPVTAWMPTVGRTVSYRNAESECDAIGMRLPTRAEAPFIAPAVTALAAPVGEVWIAGDSQCAKLVYSNGDGSGKMLCGDTFSEALPFVGDRPVICVARGGVVPALAAP